MPGDTPVPKGSKNRGEPKSGIFCEGNHLRFADWKFSHQCKLSENDFASESDEENMTSGSSEAAEKTFAANFAHDSLPTMPKFNVANRCPNFGDI